jgi:hypothetical protein
MPSRRHISVIELSPRRPSGFCPLANSHSCEIRPSWINAVALFIGAVIVFASFLRDARGVVKRARGEED